MKKTVLTHLDVLQKDDVVLLLGVPLFFNDALQETLKESQAKVIYMNPIDYKNTNLNFSQYIKYEVGSEEGICALLLNYFVQKSNPDIEAFIEDLDIGYLSAETSIGEEELEDVAEQCKAANNSYVLLSEDFLGHKKSPNIIKMLGALNIYSPLNIVIQEACSHNINAINSYSNETPEEVEELDSFNGLIICKNGSIEQHQLLGGVSFSNIAKIKDGDEVLITFEEQQFRRKFKIDTNLQGTVALCSHEGIKSLAYSYKQVKIEKVDK